MATYQNAKTTARRRADQRQRVIYVVKDPTTGVDPRVSYFIADDDDLDTFFAGFEPLAAFEPGG